MFNKILIANRGEIAIRIMRACRELGIKTVAVYSEADKDAQHVQFADEAVLIGSAAPKESYLNADALLRAALGSKAEAIHPGYGFLSENASFALKVESAGLTFIGPSADSIRAMGDKAESKIAMKKAGVPTVPGFEGLTSEEEFKKAAQEIGYPVLIKASAGGGGKGMRVVNFENELSEAIESARREALNSFGDERLLIEKYLADAHHIEFQVFGDKHGNLVHLFERECSVQRRHQKIIEETPSPLLTPEIRAKMGEAAVAAAKAVNYYNAGTIEFIFDPQLATLNLQPFYFLEMNTRLQVEHPITELTAGIDLVQWQIRIAAGEKFPFTQGDFHQHGHAIECRVYAEDPSNGFLPSTGKLLQLIEPRGPGIRVDSGFKTGSEVTHFYDPLLAKLIVHAENRNAAIQRMQTALREFVVHGVVTNMDFMQAVLQHDDFAQGKVSTRWVERNFGEWHPVEAEKEALIAAALADVLFVGGKTQSAVSNETDPFNPWKQTGNYRN
ncbi:MAG TPA: acetyl-CoA carboxylase biotin carboxylase subunit [Anaerolineales bacterium]|nr:acetyl-CoA carboxylase biotin carboxylase subunit [Anaerolineales bacterium]HMX19812.1 acetyl-CoA carboxylase biotin carboxylase subunit [Anaerolineales bacterium]HMX75870.1 acetyl-CoA carboxylase biotin carboxylase subunit [Anaerolineales bacterium]HMZ43611.1 acetyl-CoA carboxylase biotin carboxylase subunit [Anaerolineales bacterium]HNB87389.1 acetyl-CoA carboxylase biotin carboxylase subunit [Anaerolineales bacterium]